MTRNMIDFTGNHLTQVPTGGFQVAASYYNGAVSQFHVNTHDFAVKFPSPPFSRVLIDVTGANADVCTVLDIEPGDASIATGIQWVQSFKKLHSGVGTVYLDRSEFAAFVPEAAKAGQVIGRDYKVWLAWPQSSAPKVSPATGVVAVQWRQDVNGLYDESAVFDDTWHAAPVPKPAPPKTLLGHVVWVQEGVTVKPGVFGQTPLMKSTDGGKTWTVN